MVVSEIKTNGLTQELGVAGGVVSHLQHKSEVRNGYDASTKTDLGADDEHLGLRGEFRRVDHVFDHRHPH
jgi:hypothetical protein